MNRRAYTEHRDLFTWPLPWTWNEPVHAYSVRIVPSFNHALRPVENIYTAVTQCKRLSDSRLEQVRRRLSEGIGGRFPLDEVSVLSVENGRYGIEAKMRVHAATNWISRITWKNDNGKFIEELFRKSLEASRR